MYGRCKTRLWLTEAPTDLDSPFFLLPFRPDADLSTNSSARNFVCRYFKAKYEGSNAYSGTNLSHELLLTEPPVCTRKPNMQEMID